MTSAASKASHAGEAPGQEAQVWTIGVEVGGTKGAAGMGGLPGGRLLARRLRATVPQRDGASVLADVINSVLALQEEGRQAGCPPSGVGIGVAELVDVSGHIV